MTTYRFTYSTAIVEDGIHIELDWIDQDDNVICSGSAVVSRAPEEYAPILAADIRSQHEDLFEIEAANEGDFEHEV